MSIERTREVLREWHEQHPWPSIPLADLVFKHMGPDAPQDGPRADYVHTGRTYWGKQDRPVHVITSDRPLSIGKYPTLCGRSTDGGTAIGPDSDVTCRTCAGRLAALRETAR